MTIGVPKQKKPLGSSLQMAEKIEVVWVKNAFRKL